MAASLTICPSAGRSLLIIIIMIIIWALLWRWCCVIFHLKVYICKMMMLMVLCSVENRDCSCADKSFKSCDEPKGMLIFLAVQNSSLTHWLTHSTFTFDIQRATLETCDLWDIWSEWWGDMTWLKKTYLPTLENTLKGRSLTLATIETFDLQWWWQLGFSLMEQS